MDLFTGSVTHDPLECTSVQTPQGPWGSGYYSSRTARERERVEREGVIV